MKHGGNKHQAAALYGMQAADMIDLSTGISPRAYPLNLEMVSLDDLIDLPQATDEDLLINAMKYGWSVPDSAEIALAPGSGIIISLLPHIYSGKKRTVLCPWPVYSEHEFAWRQAGFTIMHYDAGEIPTLEIDDLAAVIAVQPGNPMGHVAPAEAWQHMLAEAAAQDVMVVIDEAFIDLTPDQSLVQYLGQPGMVVIRSLGKFYGLAGLRLGAAAGHKNDMTAITRLMGPWAVSTLALKYGAAAIADHDWADAQRHWLAERMSFLKDGLAQRGVNIIGGCDLYCLIEIDDAAAIQDGLAKRGFWTRIFDYNPGWMRIGLAQDDVMMSKFFAAWDALSS